MEELFSTIFGDIIFGGIKRLGALIRWIWQPVKSFDVILLQQWNTTIGFVTIVALVTIIILIWP